MGMKQILFVINNPEVYKSPNSNTYMFVASFLDDPYPAGRS